MELFLQAAAFGIITVILTLVFSGRAPVFGTLVSLCACCMVLLCLVRYLQPVMELLQRLRELAGISSQMTSVLLKAVGIGLISQLAELICQDGGQAALGKAISILSGSAIVWISLPMVEELLALVQEVLGRI